MTTEQFTRQVAGSYRSIRNTMVHMLSAEWGWLERCGGAVRGPALDARDYPNVTVLFERWRGVEASVRDFLSTLRDDDLGRVLEFALGGVTYSMPLGQLLHHAAMHAVHHRGQVALLLRSLGHVPGNFDILLYYAHRSAAPEAPSLSQHKTDDGWRVDVPLPGIDPKDVSLEVTGNNLTIRAEIPGEGQDRSVSRYEQTLLVPQFLDFEKITASHRHGMLRLMLPLKDSVRPRRIQIETEVEDQKQLVGATR